MAKWANLSPHGDRFALRLNYVCVVKTRLHLISHTLKKLSESHR